MLHVSRKHTHVHIEDDGLFSPALSWLERFIIQASTSPHFVCYDSWSRVRHSGIR